MKRIPILALALLFSGGVLAGTDHYLRRDGGHVQHLKITTRGGETHVGMDVDFEPGAGDKRGAHACSVDMDGEAKETAPNELVLKRQLENQARHCVLKIHLSGDEAKVEQSEECVYYTGHFCSFDTAGQALKKAR
ncbi:MAG TPA: hypothetical protein VI457_07215 [Methylococcaceae bacterium]|nr:hypothetical protein [Methylococcaceae bacterium]